MEPLPKVCVIDGDQAVRDSLETVMALNGHAVLTFATGEAFLSCHDAQPIGWVVCEAELPDISGMELFRRFKAGNPNARFALLTSRTDPAAAALARRSGVDAVFHKPLVHHRLTSFVSSSAPA